MKLYIILRDGDVYNVRGRNLYCKIKIFCNMFCNNDNLFNIILLKYLNRIGIIYGSFLNVNIVFKILMIIFIIEIFFKLKLILKII